MEQEKRLVQEEKEKEEVRNWEEFDNISKPLTENLINSGLVMVVIKKNNSRATSARDKANDRAFFFFSKKMYNIYFKSNFWFRV